MTEELSDKALEIARAYDAGKGIIANVDAGFMVQARSQANGRYLISGVPKSMPTINGPAEARAVRDGIRKWRRALARWRQSEAG